MTTTPQVAAQEWDNHNLCFVDPPKLYAHLVRCGVTVRPYIYALVISQGPSIRNEVLTVYAMTKRHARELAAKHDATPWNF